MPGLPLHVGAPARSSQGGQSQATVSNPRVKVGAQPTPTQPAPYAVAGCALPPPPAANGPCVTAQWIVAAIRVTAGGQPVLLQDSQAICTPTGTPLMIVQTQIRVKGM